MLKAKFNHAIRDCRPFISPTFTLVSTIKANKFKKTAFGITARGSNWTLKFLLPFEIIDNCYLRSKVDPPSDGNLTHLAGFLSKLTWPTNWIEAIYSVIIIQKILDKKLFLGFTMFIFNLFYRYSVGSVPVATWQLGLIPDKYNNPRCFNELWFKVLFSNSCLEPTLQNPFP